MAMEQKTFFLKTFFLKTASLMVMLIMMKNVKTWLGEWVWQGSVSDGTVRRLYWQKGQRTSHGGLMHVGMFHDLIADECVMLNRTRKDEKTTTAHLELF